KKLIPTMFKVKIVELEDKTGSEIRTELEQNEKYYNKYYKRENSNEEEFQRDKRGYIIWPPSEATHIPLIIQGIVQGSRAIFGMSDYTWLNSRVKWYGVLVSNDDGKSFAGREGKEDQPVKLEVIVEEGEQFVNFVRIQLSSWEVWLITPFIVTVLTLIGAFIVVEFLQHRDKQKLEKDQDEKIRLYLENQANMETEKRVKEQNANKEWLDRYKEGKEEVVENFNVPNPYKEYTIRDEMMTDHTAYRGKKLEKNTVNQPLLSSSSSSSSSSSLLNSSKPKLISNIPHAPFTGHLANRIPPPVDFSWLQSGNRELDGVDWGEAGPPPTLSLAYQGIYVVPQNIIEKQIEWEKLQQNVNPLVIV
ncbi:MAG: hypothetical protein EZS28_009221, partial [Streblomastix strix]